MTEFDARSQALAESRFYAHLAVFAVASAVLLGVNLVTGPDPLWAGWTVLAWGLVVLSHAGSTFGVVLGEDWVRRRTAALQGGLAEAEIYQILDDVLRARSAPAGTSRTLRQLEKRVGELEAAPEPLAPVADPFDLGAARAVGRPVSPEAIGARPVEVAGDPFADARQPIETPRLDGLPKRRRKNRR